MNLFEVPGYQIIEELSENETFLVYHAQRLQDNSPVLLKVLNQPNPTLKVLAPLWQEFESCPNNYNIASFCYLRL